MPIGNLLFDKIWQVTTVDDKTEIVSFVDILSDGENYKDVVMPFANLKVSALVFFISAVEVIYEFKRDTDVRRFREKKHSKQEIIDKINARGIANWFDFENFLQFPDDFTKDIPIKDASKISNISLNIADDSNEAHFGGAFVNTKHFCPKCALMILLQHCVNGYSKNGYVDNITSSLGTITLLKGENLLSTINLNLFHTQKTTGNPFWLNGKSNDNEYISSGCGDISLFNGKKQMIEKVNNKFNHLSLKEKKTNEEYKNAMTEAISKKTFNLSNDSITLSDLLFFNINQSKIIWEQEKCSCDFCGNKTSVSTNNIKIKSIPLKHSFYDYPFSSSIEKIENKKKGTEISHKYQRFDDAFVWKNFFQYILGKNFENTTILNKNKSTTLTFNLPKNIEQNINRKSEISGFILFMPTFDDHKGKTIRLFTSEEFFTFSNYNKKDIEDKFCEIVRHCYKYYELLNSSSFNIARFVNSENTALKDELSQRTKRMFNNATETCILKLMKEIDDYFVDNYEKEFIMKIKKTTLDLFDKCFIQYKDKNVKEYFKIKNFFKNNVVKHYSSY